MGFSSVARAILFAAGLVLSSSAANAQTPVDDVLDDTLDDVSLPDVPLVSAPELDPNGAAAGATLLIGGVLVIFGRRRRSD